jgi:hypothetical protein
MLIARRLPALALVVASSSALRRSSTPCAKKVDAVRAYFQND